MIMLFDIVTFSENVCFCMLNVCRCLQYYPVHDRHDIHVTIADYRVWQMYISEKTVTTYNLQLIICQMHSKSC